ncbi:DNA polymerase/3'-5' exonuclease PolX [Oxobacter pfennigii]|uniref:DNA polymerase/3'-5' exonuclease PolX n=1 Tax=Oxobacter pfennigii TaxID=36849 RepID=A0A0P8X5H0_9CLOT|nr:DNA polymerase/3'-5' exonuclease PolX [Oxobacter pfennigii]KPU46057.1 DNA polymerase/3'-5' exonuclease PolX [Oxobacter pfennigii]
MNKKEVAKLLKNIGELLEIKGENEFKVRAYYNGVKIIENLDEDIITLVKEDRLKDMKGIGKALNDKISEYVNTGEIQYYNNLVNDTPKEIFEFLKIPGLGPKKIRDLHYNMGIKTLGELEYACVENKLLNYKGFGEKSQGKIMEGLKTLNKNKGKFLYSNAYDIAHNIMNEIKKLDAVKTMELSGTLRRKWEWISEIDIVICTENKKEFLNRIKELNFYSSFQEESDKISGMTNEGIMLNIYMASPDEYIYKLFETTGCNTHVNKIKSQVSQEMILNAGSEAEIYKSCGLEYIEPELREDEGEIEKSQNNKLPKLVTLKDIKGIFHVHTNYSDGINTIEEMASMAKAMGYFYIGIGDHSKSSFYARGLSESDVRKQLYEISLLNDSSKDMRIFKGIECNILEDGALDYDDSILELFDYVVASVHSGFSMSEEKMTDRIIKAMSNKYVTILGHPTGRLLLSRKPYKMDFEKIIKASVDYGVILEINGNPHRMDLDWKMIKEAKKYGAKFAINPDAHSIEGIYDTLFGLNMARKGGLEPSDLINTMDVSKVDMLFKNKRLRS